jgi:cobalt-zinc-cadmium efflux system membrane fusion protein
MNVKNWLSIAAVVLVGIVLGFFILRLEPATVSTEEHEAQSEQVEAGLMAKGPHGGRLLTQDGFEVEITIYERGVPPQFRVYAYEQGKPLSPEQVQLTIELHRLGGRIDPIQFQKEGDYLRGDRVIEEPHSFDVKIGALYHGKSYHWAYSQEEGRVALGPEALRSAGIEVETAGPARIRTLLDLPGEINLNQNHLAHVVPRVDSVVTAVYKKLSDPVKEGEVIAVLESRELADLKGGYLASIKRRDNARATFEREKRLWQAKISAEQDYLTSRKDLAEADIAVEIALQKLLALGLSKQELQALARGTGETLARFDLRAPFDGMVIEKHMVQGEAVKADTTVFVIADLSSVWGEITVYAKDLNLVRLGQEVTVKSAALDLMASGTLSYLGPLVGEETRSAQAHVHIANPDGRWRPGLFVTVEVVQEEVTVPVAVSAEAIQTYRDWQVVFAQYGDRFEVRPLQLGRRDGQWVEVVKGLSAGERYAATNSFVLKADLGKSGATHDH